MTSWRGMRGIEVIDTETAEVVGRIEQLMVDPSEPRVFGFRLEEGGTLAWDDVAPLGGDVATVHGDPRREAESNNASDPLGTPIFTESGTSVGTLTDLEIDDQTGSILDLRVPGDRVDGSRLMGMGSFAVVVADASTA